MRARRLFRLSSLAMLIVAVAGVALAGCGDTVDADAFVGTWRAQMGDSTANSAPFTIAKTSDGYVATMTYSTSPPVTFGLKQEGDKLVGSYGEGNQTTSVEITYLSDSGHLAWKDAWMDDGPPLELIRVSDSTVPPTSSP